MINDLVLNGKVEQVKTQLADIATKVETSKTVDLFMAMGQSNMGGRGIAAQAPVVPTGQAYEFRAISDPAKLYNVIEPFGVNENNISGINDGAAKTGSMISAFAIAYYNSTRIPSVYVSASKGGTAISTWQPNGAYLNDAIARLTAAKTWLQNNGYNIRHTYMLWCQGESDGDISTGKYNYTTSLEAMINEMCNNHGVEKCFIIRIGNDRDYPLKYDNIISAQTEFCKTRTKAIIISTKLVEFADRGLMKDEYHYTQPAYNEAGYDAGYNCALYVKNGIPPTLNDYKYNNLYYPYTVNGDKKLVFPFDTDKENGILDVVPCGVILGGYIDTNTTYGYKKLLEPFTLNCLREWSVEFTIDPTQVVNGSDQSGIIAIGDAAINKNFIFVNNYLNQIRIRDNNSIDYNFSVLAATLDVKHNYCITYNGAGSLSLYIDGTLSSTISAANITDIVIKHILGGYGSGSYNSAFDYRGLCYYFGFINKSLKSYQMHNE